MMTSDKRYSASREGCDVHRQRCLSPLTPSPGNVARVGGGGATASARQDNDGLRRGAEDDLSGCRVHAPNCSRARLGGTTDNGSADRRETKPSYGDASACGLVIPKLCVNINEALLFAKKKHCLGKVEGL